MSIWIGLIASFLGAILSAMGMGGGGLFLLYLTIVSGFTQLKAQGINLIFFIPCAIVAIFIHNKNKLIEWKVALIGSAFAVIGVFAGFFLSSHLNEGLLSKLFGVFLLIIGAKELFSKNKKR